MIRSATDMTIRYLGTLALIAALGCARHDERDRQIVFDSKAFIDIVDYVYVAGTLTGEGVPYENNTTAVTCYKNRMECLTIGINQIGPNQVSRLDSPDSYPVTKWDANEIVARGPGDVVNCRQVTISIVRKTEMLLWVEEPINQASAACKNAETRLLKWTIEDWREVKHANLPSSR